MNIYIYPALIALLINFAVIWAASKGRTKTKGFVPLVIGFSLLNICEIAIHFVYLDPTFLELGMRFYYALAVLSLSLIVLYSAEVSMFQTKSIRYAVLLGVVVVSFASLFTDVVISGVRSIEYSRTAIKGSGYFLFQIVSLSMLSSIAYMLIAGYRRADSHQQQIKCAGTLVAILPNVIACLVVLLLMSLGYKVNAVGIIPVTMMLFILITLAFEERHELTDIRRFIPGSAERKCSGEVMEICSRYARDEVSYRSAISEIERVLTVHKYQKNSKNASVTAELMGMPRSSLYSIFNRLKIDSKNG